MVTVLIKQNSCDTIVEDHVEQERDFLFPDSFISFNSYDVILNQWLSHCAEEYNNYVASRNYCTSAAYMKWCRKDKEQ
jgi:hypothetical protein